jgi:addiction module HigA family antidote
MNIPVSRISDIIHDRRDITAATAIRLGRALGTTPDFWMNMQTAWSLAKLEDEALDVTPVLEKA